MAIKISIRFTFVCVLVFALSGCRYDKETFLKPQVEHQSGLPVAYGNLGLPELLPDTLISSDTTGKLQFIYEQTFSSEPLNNLVSFPPTSNTLSFSIDEIAMPDQALDFGVSLKDIVQGSPIESTIFGAVGTEIPFPSLPTQNLQGELISLEDINWIRLSEGEISLDITNNLPVAIIDYSLGLLNPSNSATLVSFAVSSLLPGETSSQTISLNGLELPGTLLTNVSVGLQGSGTDLVLIDTTQRTEATTRLEGLLASAGEMITPAQVINYSDTLFIEAEGTSEVSYLEIKDGSLTLNMSNDFGIQLASTVNFNTVKHSGVPLKILSDLDASTGSPTESNNQIDLSGFGITLINENNPGEASFPFSFELIINPKAEMVSFDLLNDELSLFTEIEVNAFEKIEGELNYDPFDFENNQSLPLENIFKSFNEGSIEFTDVSFGISFDNTAGIEGLIDLELSSTNGKTGEEIPLTGTTSFLLKRALDNPLAPAPNNGFELNKDNSNIGAVISNFPTAFNSKISVSKPEGGDKYDDFLYGNSELIANLYVKAPLSLIIKNLTIADTFDFNIDVPKEANRLKRGEFIIQALNGFPVGLALTLNIYDEFGSSLEVLKTETNSVLPAELNNAGKVTQAKVSEIIIPLDDQTFQKIRDARQIEVVATLDSDGNAITFYNDYDLGFRLLADLIFDFE